MASVPLEPERQTGYRPHRGRLRGQQAACHSAPASGATVPRRRLTQPLARSARGRGRSGDSSAARAAPGPDLGLAPRVGAAGRRGPRYHLHQPLPEVRAPAGRKAGRRRAPGPPLTPVSAAGRRRRPTCAPDSTAPRHVPRRQRRRPLLPPPPHRRRDGSSACWPHSSAPWPTASRHSPPTRPEAGPGRRPRPSRPALTTPPRPSSWATPRSGRAPPLRTRATRPARANKRPCLPPSTLLSLSARAPVLSAPPLPATRRAAPASAAGSRRDRSRDRRGRVGLGGGAGSGR